MRRVVVTGMGAICSHGNSVGEIFDAIEGGSNHISAIDQRTHFDSSLYKQTTGRVAAAVPYTDDELIERMGSEYAKELKRYDRHQLFARHAASEALLSAFKKLPHDRERFGVSVGTGDGGLATGFESDVRLIKGEKGGKLSPFANLGELPNIFAGQIANHFGLKGPGFVHCTACAASAHAIMHGADQIKLDRADQMLVGGAEAAITPFGIASFAAQHAMGTDSRPYQGGRDGFVMGEGAAMLVLEALDHARARGATILAELVGYASTMDGVQGGAITAPDVQGGYRAAQLALDMADLFPEQIGYVNTHGTGTAADAIELDGIKKWSGSFAGDILVSSTKSWIGHLLGAAGAIESVLSIEMVRRGLVLPTRALTLENLDLACEGVDHVMSNARVQNFEYVLSNSFGFGGTNATLIFQRYDR